MPRRKSFTAPIWWLSISVLFQSLTILALYAVTQRYNTQSNIPVSVYVERGVFLLLLIAELVFYIMYRKAIQIKKIAWGHVVGIVIAFLVIPLIQIVLPLWYTYNKTAIQYAAAFDVWNYALRLMFWSFLVLSHIFFGWLLLKGLHRKNEAPTVVSEEDILNEYAE